MSLINQVLKDLDRQRGPADGLQFAALQGIGLVQSKQGRHWTSMLVVGTGALVLLVIFLFQLAGNRAIENGVAESDAAIVDVPDNTVIVQSQPLETTAEIIGAALPPLSTNPDVPATGKTEPIEAAALPVTPTAVETSPPPIKTLSTRQRAEHTFAAGQQSMTRGDKTRAEQLFNDTIDYHPQYHDARIQLAAILIERSDTVAAEHLLKDGLFLDPGHAQLARLYAQLLAARGEFDGALRALPSVTESQTLDAESLALRAAVNSRLNNHEEASSNYRLALKLDQRQANWWMGLGLSLEHQGLYGSARDAYQQAYKLPLEDNVKAFVGQRLEQLQNTAGDN